MATLLKVLNNLADIKSAGGVALRVRTQALAKHPVVAAWAHLFTSDVKAETPVHNVRSRRHLKLRRNQIIHVNAELICHALPIFLLRFVNWPV